MSDRSKVVEGAAPRAKPPAAGKGRAKGVPNKSTALLKDAILKAAEGAGGKAGLVGYLQMLAVKHPPVFGQLLGKVIPLQVTGEGGGPVVISWKAAADDDG